MQKPTAARAAKYCAIREQVSPTAARSIRIVTRGESIISGTTGIASVGMEAAKDEIYDLVGRKVERVTVPGIYIVNGKRVLIK